MAKIKALAPLPEERKMQKHLTNRKSKVLLNPGSFQRDNGAKMTAEGRTKLASARVCVHPSQSAKNAPGFRNQTALVFHTILTKWVSECTPSKGRGSFERQPSQEP